MSEITEPLDISSLALDFSLDPKETRLLVREQKPSASMKRLFDALAEVSKEGKLLGQIQVFNVKQTDKYRVVFFSRTSDVESITQKVTNALQLEFLKKSVQMAVGPASLEPLNESPSLGTETMYQGQEVNIDKLEQLIVQVGEASGSFEEFEELFKQFYWYSGSDIVKSDGTYYRPGFGKHGVICGMIQLVPEEYQSLVAGFYDRFSKAVLENPAVPISILLDYASIKFRWKNVAANPALPFHMEVATANDLDGLVKFYSSETHADRPYPRKSPGRTILGIILFWFEKQDGRPSTTHSFDVLSPIIMDWIDENLSIEGHGHTLGRPVPSKRGIVTKKSISDYMKDLKRPPPAGQYVPLLHYSKKLVCEYSSEKADSYCMELFRSSATKMPGQEGIFFALGRLSLLAKKLGRPMPEHLLSELTDGKGL